MRRWLPWGLLVAALAGMLVLSDGFRLVDTVGLLVCGAAAGAALAEIAAARRKRR